VTDWRERWQPFAWAGLALVALPLLAGAIAWAWMELETPQTSVLVRNADGGLVRQEVPRTDGPEGHGGIAIEPVGDAGFLVPVGRPVVIQIIKGGPRDGGEVDPRRLLMEP
jgi:hypothetical protein